MAANNVNPQSRDPSLNAADLPQIKKVLAAMQDTWSNIGQTYDVLHEQSVKLSGLSPTMHQTVQKIQKIHDQIQSRVNADNNEIKKTKQGIQNEVRGDIMKAIKAGLKKEIKSQITLQVSDQIPIQIKEHLPVTLEGQLRESRAQFEEVKVSLVNSEARHKNSTLRIPRDLVALLSNVLTANGSVSAFFPATLTALFAFDLKTSQSLARDYKLHVSEVKEENFNNFMSHIGVKYSLPVFRL